MFAASRDLVRHDVARFAAYCDSMESLFALQPQAGDRDRLISGFLNGDATTALQELVPLRTRRDAGIFFTNGALAERVAERLGPILGTGAAVVDPACGAGNLLLASAKYLPRGVDLQHTLAIWSSLLFGHDLHPEFVRAAQLRLALLVQSLHPESSSRLGSRDAYEAFTGVRIGDALAQNALPSNACFAVNPPFGHMLAPSDCRWARGKIQVAAWFLDQILDRAVGGQQVVAVLPDVLRSGSRYRKWRDSIGARCGSNRQVASTNTRTWMCFSCTQL